MGSRLSGQYRTDTQTTVEACLCLDLQWFLWLGAGQAGGRWEGTVCWPAGAQPSSATIGYVLDLREPPGLHLTYERHVAGEPPPVEPLVYCIPLISSPQHDSRRWFMCPLGREEIACGRRVRKMYFPPGRTYFGCRHCYELTYASRQARGPALVREWPEITMTRTDVVEARLLGAGQQSRE